MDKSLMTLEQVRDQIASLEGSDSHRKSWVKAIDAHLATRDAVVSDEDVERACRVYNKAPGHTNTAGYATPHMMRAALESLASRKVAVPDVVDEPAYDREALVYLMRAFYSESWQCPKCGHEEDTATMDSAYFLRDYLASHPSATADDVSDASRLEWLDEQVKQGTRIEFAKGLFGNSVEIGLRSPPRAFVKDTVRDAIDAAQAAERGEVKS